MPTQISNHARFLPQSIQKTRKNRNRTRKAQTPEIPPAPACKNSTWLLHQTYCQERAGQFEPKAMNQQPPMPQLHSSLEPLMRHPWQKLVTNTLWLCLSGDTVGKKPKHGLKPSFHSYLTFKRRKTSEEPLPLVNKIATVPRIPTILTLRPHTLALSGE